MTRIGNVYGEAMYSLAREEDAAAAVLDELAVLEQCFAQESDFLRLLASPTLTKEERCAVLEESFRGRVHPYVLNFLKILTERGYIRQFSDAQACIDCQQRGVGETIAIGTRGVAARSVGRGVEQYRRIAG